MREKF